MVYHRHRLNCRDGFCGALDCETCYGLAAVRYRAQAAHESHDDPDLDMDECPECRQDRIAAGEAEYDRRKEEGRL